MARNDSEDRAVLSEEMRIHEVYVTCERVRIQ